MSSLGPEHLLPVWEHKSTWRCLCRSLPGRHPEDSTLESAQDLERTQKRVGVFRSET